MKKMWWKILGAVLVFVGLTVGMLVPLKPGIINVSQRSIEGGQMLDLGITGYNTRFSSSTYQKAYLKLENNAMIKSYGMRVLGDRNLTAKFKVPKHLPLASDGARATLIVDTDNDGYMVLPDALFINQRSIAIDKGRNTWNDQINKLRVLDEYRFPFRPVLYETIRNTFYHITLWFSMFILLIAALVFSIKFLKNKNPEDDIKAASFTKVAIFFGVCGVITGSIWARFTWGAFWTSDVKLNMSAVAMLIYLAYLILRSSIKDHGQRARLSAVYNIFAFAALIPLVFVIPRLTDSLHPGNGGNPALGGEDMDHTLRMIFYPTIIGFTLIGVWISSLLVRIELLKETILLKD